MKSNLVRQVLFFFSGVCIIPKALVVTDKGNGLIPFSLLDI